MLINDQHFSKISTDMSFSTNNIYLLHYLQQKQKYIVKYFKYSTEIFQMSLFTIKTFKQFCMQ